MFARANRSPLMVHLASYGHVDTAYAHGSWDSGTCLVLCDGRGSLVWVPVLAEFITCFVTLSKMFIIAMVSIS